MQSPKSDPQAAAYRLPDVIHLQVERRGDWWLVQPPDYPGLYVAHRDLTAALADVPKKLLALIRRGAEMHRSLLDARPVSNHLGPCGQ